MTYHDISLNLSTDTVRWVVAPPLEVHERRRMRRGDEVNASALTVSVHAGTHLDAPLHFVPGGAAIDALPLERFIGPALVLDGAPCRAVLRELTDGTCSPRAPSGV